MNNFYKYSFFAITTIGMGILAFEAFRKRKNTGAPKDETSRTGGTNSSSAVFPLKLGSSGEEVKWMQNLLNEYFNAGLEVNGNFDAATDAALRSAQTSSKARLALRLKGTPEGWKIGEVSYGTYTMINDALA